MRIEIQLRIVGDDNSVISADEVLHFDKSDDRVEAIGLSFGDTKAVLGAIQERTAQAASFLARHRCCNHCGRALVSKGPGWIQFRTASGTIPLNSPRFYRCRCQSSASKARCASCSLSAPPRNWFIPRRNGPHCSPTA